MRISRADFSLNKLNEAKDKEQFRVETSGKLASLETLDTIVDINRAWETTGEDIKVSAKENDQVKEDDKGKSCSANNAEE